MTNIPFSQLNFSPEIERAISEMGFEFAMPVQAAAIPIIRAGADVIARSQTGTGKTIAFAIPAIERIDTNEEKATIQVLILCPTRELAQQAAEEIRKIARFNTEIRPVEIYGGAAIDKQCIRLRKANIVIGTPGRVMDHMRRKTIKLSNLKMVVLDEADEMLSMGFKEDIETILVDTPQNRQTILFSATMPPSILALTKEFQKDPQLIEINKSQVTIEDIEQSYLYVPSNRKKDALSMLIKFYQPHRALIFCNTKKMVDELNEFLTDLHFSVESIHSDIKQDQRTSVMQGFKHGRTSILIATDIAARGIDVNDIDFVINYDLPQNTEYYIHRIGRTGRAGKSGRSITICSSKREINIMRSIAYEVKSEINQMNLPSHGDIQKLNSIKAISAMEEAIQSEIQPSFLEMADKLAKKGYSEKNIAAAALQLHFAIDAPPDIVTDIKQRDLDTAVKGYKRSNKISPRNADYETVMIDIGSAHHIAANHIIGAITEITDLVGSDIGKVSILPKQTIVEIPSGRSNEVLKAMSGCKICGRAVKTVKMAETNKTRRSTAGSAIQSHSDKRNNHTSSAGNSTPKSRRPRG